MPIVIVEGASIEEVTDAAQAVVRTHLELAGSAITLPMAAFRKFYTVATYFFDDGERIIVQEETERFLGECMRTLLTQAGRTIDLRQI